MSKIREYDPLESLGKESIEAFKEKDFEGIDEIIREMGKIQLKMYIIKRQSLCDGFYEYLQQLD